jgi:RNA polymerase I-specific transcription initiation factor RRN3
METDEAAHALDEMMFLVLEYLQKRIESANQIIGAAATGDENYRNAQKSIERLREALVSRAFFTTLLPAPKSKFAQYIVFYLCSMDFNDGDQQNSVGASKSSCELLRDGLVAKMLNSNEANSLRLAAAAYLASFVARAKFLSAEFVVETLETVCGWLIRKVHENNVKAMSEVELNAFDSCCQAVMYILCYRCDEIANNDEKSKKRLQALPLREILYAPTLEPLRSCLLSVVHEFLKNASAANILGFTEDMIDTFSKQTEERKKIQDELRDKAYVRHDVSFAAKAMAAAVEKTNNTNNDATDKSMLYHQERSRRRPLKMFFPFDPYVLRKSAPKLNLEESYVVWRGNDSDSEDDSEEDSDDNSESELALSDSEDDSSEEEENSASMDGSGEFIGRPQSKSSLSSGHLNRVRARSLGRSFNSAKFGTSLNARPKKQQNRSRGFSPKNTNGAGLPTGVLATQKGFRMPMPLSKSPSPSRGDVVAGYQSFSPLRGSFGGGFVKARSPSPNRRSSSPTTNALTRAKVPPSSTLSAEVNNQAKGGGQQRRASTRSSSKRKS